MGQPARILRCLRRPKGRQVWPIVALCQHRWVTMLPFSLVFYWFQRYTYSCFFFIYTHISQSCLRGQNWRGRMLLVGQGRDSNEWCLVSVTPYYGTHSDLACESLSFCARLLIAVWYSDMMWYMTYTLVAILASWIIIWALVHNEMDVLQNIRRWTSVSLMNYSVSMVLSNILSLLLIL